MPDRIAIALGDPRGIGPEVTLRAIASELGADDARYLLIGDPQPLHVLKEAMGLQLSLQAFGGDWDAGRVLLHAPSSSTDFKHSALTWLADGAQRCLRGEADALVTSPVNKEAIIRAGEKSFVGQTEFLSALAGTSNTVMMLLGADDRGRWLRVALATIHIPLKEVPARLGREKIELAIERAAQACRDLRLPRARIAVCGLNPHAGEGGEFGDEEITTITPAVEAARQKGFDVTGPLAADTLFHYAYRGDYDAVVAMYHDQGLAPLKMVAFENGVNWTLGLPFIRTSPDHGTAYDIAGKGAANPSSMIAAIRLAKQLTRQQDG